MGADASARQDTSEACTLMELLLRCVSIQAESAPPAAGEAWPPQRFLRLARVLQHNLLSANRPPELLLGNEKQRADHLVRLHSCSSCQYGAHVVRCTERQLSLWRILMSRVACVAIEGDLLKRVSRGVSGADQKF